MIALKTRRRNTNPPNREVGLLGEDHTNRLVRVKVTTPLLASYVRGLTKYLNAHKRQHYVSSKKNFELIQKLSTKQ